MNNRVFVLLIIPVLLLAVATIVYAETTWDRGRVFVCETGYAVRTDHLPMVSWFYPRGYVPLQARVALSIEPYVSRWGE